MALVPLARDFWGGAGKGVWKERRKQPGHCEQNYGTIKLDNKTAVCCWSPEEGGEGIGKRYG